MLMQRWQGMAEKLSIDDKTIKFSFQKHLNTRKFLCSLSLSLRLDVDCWSVFYTSRQTFAIARRQGVGKLSIANPIQKFSRLAAWKTNGTKLTFINDHQKLIKYLKNFLPRKRRKFLMNEKYPANAKRAFSLMKYTVEIINYLNILSEGENFIKSQSLFSSSCCRRFSSSHLAHWIHKDWYWYLFYILHQAPPSQLIFYKLSRNDSNLESTILGIHFPITQQHFVRGKLKVNWHRFFLDA